MKKFLIIASIVMMAIGQMAAKDYEYVPFVREGVKWVYYYVNDDDGFYPPDPELASGKVYVNLEFKGDTTINGKTYKAMHKYHGKEINAMSDTIPIYMREMDKVVYGIVPNGKTYSDCPIGNSYNPEIYDRIGEGEEFVLYDFNDPVGYWDQLVNQSGYDDQYQLQYIDTIAIGLHLAKRYVSQLWGEFHIVEGIGIDALSSYTLDFFMPMITGPGTTYYALSHVIENGRVIYKGIQFDDGAIEYETGDVNRDGEVNISDVTTLIDILLRKQ